GRRGRSSARKRSVWATLSGLRARQYIAEGVGRVVQLRSQWTEPPGVRVVSLVPAAPEDGYRAEFRSTRQAGASGSRHGESEGTQAAPGVSRRGIGKKPLDYS